MTTINNIDMAMQIVTIPRKSHAMDMSPSSLLEATGYFERHDQISEDDIRAALLRCPECIQEWMQYAEDQRSSSAWYFTLNDEGLYETGHFDIKSIPNNTNRVQYKKAIDDCAAFIKHVI